VGNRTVLANGVTLAGHVEVEDGAVIGGLTAVHQFSRIGQLAMIGGCSAVDQDVAPFCMALGNRLSLRGLNLLGLKRAGVPKDAIRTLREAYTTLFVEKQPLKEAVQEVRERWPEDAQIQVLTEFLEASERGVCR